MYFFQILLVKIDAKDYFCASNLKLKIKISNEINCFIVFELYFVDIALC